MGPTTAFKVGNFSDRGWGISVILSTDDQWMKLAVEGVDYGQGFLFSRPIEAEAVANLLGNINKRDEQSLTVR